jgi:hypothetical protein
MCGRVGDVWPDDTRNVDYEAFQTGECMDIIGYLWMHVFCFFVCGDQNLLLPSAAHNLGEHPPLPAIPFERPVDPAGLRSPHHFNDFNGNYQNMNRHIRLIQMVV